MALRRQAASSREESSTVIESGANTSTRPNAGFRFFVRKPQTSPSARMSSIRRSVFLPS